MSCQDVCLDMYADFDSQFSRSVTRRAAKAHKCDECGDVIAVGDSYEYASGKCEGDFWDSHTCAACAEIRTTFVCGGWVVGELWTTIEEQMFPRWNEITAIDCLARLTSDAAVAKMRAEYAEYREARL